MAGKQLMVHGFIVNSVIQAEWKREDGKWMMAGKQFMVQSFIVNSVIQTEWKMDDGSIPFMALRINQITSSILPPTFYIFHFTSYILHLPLYLIHLPFYILHLTYFPYLHPTLTTYSCNRKSSFRYSIYL